MPGGGDTALGGYLIRRALHSLFALIGLIMLVFFLARLTGSPADEIGNVVFRFLDISGFQM